MLLPNGNNAKASEPKEFAGFAAARDTANWPDRRRGHSNFLTWAFFLAEIVVADIFFGRGANAADDLNAPSTDAKPPHPTDYDESGGINWSHVDPELETGDPNLASQATSASSLSPRNSEATPPSLSGNGEEAAVHNSLAGGSGAGGPLPSSDEALSSDLDTPVVAPGLESNLFSSLEPGLAAELGLEPILYFGMELEGNILSGPTLDLSLDLQALGLDVSVESSLLSGLALDVGLGDAASLDGVLGGTLSGLIDEVTGLNLVGAVDGLTALLWASEGQLGESGMSALASANGLASQGLLSDTTGAVASIVPEATLLAPLSQAGALSSGDAIIFPELVPLQIETDSLFTGGQYSDYSLALQTDRGAGEGPVQAVDGGASEGSDLMTVVAADDQGSVSAVGLVDLSSADHDLLRGLSI